MSFTYFKFLFVNTVKKKSIWITWVLFLLTCTAFLIILPLFAQMNTLQVWSNTTMAICQTFMGMVAGLFTAVLSINIFKDTNEDGTELIVISKPISRFKLVMSKFVLFGFYCLLINLSAVIISAFTYFLPRTEKEFYVGLLVSMFIGNLITFGVFGSISILMSVNFAKVGIIITNILISLVFLIFQTLTLFVFPTPLKELDNQYMSASTYIVHNRDLNSGDYKEDEVVHFTPSIPEGEVAHPCHATNWQEMKQYWEQDILSKDPTPILNLTDLASQLSLTYMSYKTDKFAQRQAERMFAWTRFYNYDLTSPASPELFDPDIENQQSIPWVYTQYGGIPIPWQEEGHQDIYHLYGALVFDGITPLTGTRLRGYSDTIPVGSIRSKKQLFSQEVYFEKDLWNKYSKPFDLMYDLVFDYHNYLDFYTEDEIKSDISECSSFFCKKNEALKHYYELIWSCFMQQTQSDDPKLKLLGDPEKLAEMAKYGPTYFDIHSVKDLNERFIQFKNYVLWKIYQEQQQIFSGNVEMLDLERQAKNEAYNHPCFDTGISYDIFHRLLGVELPTDGWMMKDIYDEDNMGLLPNYTQCPCFDFMQRTYDFEHELIKDMELYSEQLPIISASSFVRMKKTVVICEFTADESENYMFDSLLTPIRQWNYTGDTYIARIPWYPNVNGIAKEVLGVNIPVGQNMQLFYFETTPKVRYWIFSVVWGSISIALFASGVIIYNKYDVK